MANDVSELKQKIENNLNDDSKPWAPILKYLEEVSGLNRTNIFWGFVAFVGLWLAFGLAGQLICNFIGIVYPAYASVHAIESRAINDDTKWLTYWVVFSIFSLIEYFADFIVGWFSLYWLIKSVFFLWLMIPTDLNGSLMIYKNVIKPYFLQYHETVDKACSAVQAKASEIIEHKNK
ncbi:hypothetical protein ILUMI_02141 [Ignelater luminosus]|uniref:Receptor expression-enhancing protein n=1 Tax=Ignelater luminosus TaxID=2038154 RepID=A0A8K0DE11_IGNLU|nr:hypothetical protein ILUMI_02141 [Ignelater luminosus]